MYPSTTVVPPPTGTVAEVLDGLHQPQPALPSKLFYDARGSELFEAICQLPEYYLTRVELALLEQHAGAMAGSLGARALVIEPGSGSSQKTRILLAQLADPVAYVPVDISPEPLAEAAAALRSEFPTLEVLPVVGDFTLPFAVPSPFRAPASRQVYFPGSTIGNLMPAAATAFLAHLGRLVAPNGGVLIGVDTKKDAALLNRAYNDDAGVTAAFNRNILAHVNALCDADFDLAGWQHCAFYNAEAGRIEMHLQSTRDQWVHIAGETLRFARGADILTEVSYKYHVAEFAALAERAGLVARQVWVDADGWFSVHYLAATSGGLR
jgi:dimethylhistidine N-methyltransferase